MKINFKRLFIIFLLFIFTITLYSCKKEDNKNNGYDGRTFDISLNQDGKVMAKTTKVGVNYELVISGSGAVKSYDKKELVPWNAISKKITSVKIEEGIENIGNYYFYSCTLDSYYIPSSVIEVEENSFNSNATIYSYSTDVITSDSLNQIYYYSETKPTTSGKYWHMVGVNPVVWEKVKMLFIGNSFTFYPSSHFSDTNPGVCYLTNEIAKKLGVELDIDFVVKGAHTLKKFANASDEKGKIVDELLKSNNDYDYIILQEHSTTPANDYNSFNAGVKSLVAKINETQTNAQVYLYSTWGFPSGVNNSLFSSVSVMEGLIRDAYTKCASENEVKVSYVGEAFTKVYEDHKDINLYGSDDKHQSYAGAYLSACVHLSTILGIDVRGAEFYGELDATVARTLQNVAYDIVFK